MSTPNEKPIVLTRAQVREVDRRAIEEFGIPGIVLMENAGRNAAALVAEWSKPGDQVAIVCGPGNNGGDGFVIARHLSNAGMEVVCLLVFEFGKLQGDALLNYQIVQRMGLGSCVTICSSGIEVLAYHLRKSTLVVDAMLGTGFSGEPRPPMDAAIRAVNAAKRRVVAIDVPSGMDCDTGEPAIGRSHNVGDFRCVKAWRTITFVAMKPGFLMAGASEFTGEVFVADVGAPVKLIQEIAASGA